MRFEIEGTRTGCLLRMIETPAGVYKTISAVAQPLIRLRNERSLSRLESFVAARQPA